MINSPLVSICIPTYNSSSHLLDCLDSIASQSYLNIEVIICDNNSSDNTFLIASEYSTRFNWRCVQNQKNIGALANFNQLISLCSGEFIAIYHADDIYESTIVSSIMDRFALDPTLNIVGTSAYTIDHLNNITGEYCNPFNSCDAFNYYSREEVLFSIVNQFNASKNKFNIPLLLVSPSIIVRRKAYERYGFFDVNLHFKSASDYEMWIRLTHHSPICIINKPLMKYRIHNNQASQFEIRDKICLPDIYNLIFYHIVNSDNSDLINSSLSFLNKITRGTALKQNRSGKFSLSKNTTKYHFGISFSLLIVNVFNSFKIKIPTFKFNSSCQ